MATLGEALQAELNGLLGRYVPDVTVPRGFVSPRPQANYLVGQLGAGPAAAMLGVTAKTLRKWLAGATPTKANKAKLDAAYHQVRDPRARKSKADKTRRATQQKLIKALTAPPGVRVQVSGTVQISSDEEYRDNWGTNPEIPARWWRKIVDAWRKRKGAAHLGELMEQALNDAAPAGGAWVHWPDEASDAVVYILLTLAEG